MAEENVKNITTARNETETNVDTKDRGLFDNLLGKKDDNEKKHQEGGEVLMASEFDQKVQVSEPVHEEKKPGLLGKLHRSDSSSSSSSEEEEVEGEDGVKIKRKKEKKGLKEEIKEKISSGNKSEEKKEETHVPVEVVHVEEAPSEEKKAFLDKIKEKLPGGAGHAKKDDQTTNAASPTMSVPAPAAASSVEETAHHDDAAGKEKKGFLDKIKEKLPGYHPKSDEDKEKEKDSAASH